MFVIWLLLAARPYEDAYVLTSVWTICHQHRKSFPLLQGARVSTILAERRYENFVVHVDVFLS